MHRVWIRPKDIPVPYAGAANVRFDTPPRTAADGTIVLASDRMLLALAPDGSLRWRFLLPEENASENGFGGPLIASDGTIYVLLKHRIVALSLEGKQIWEVNLPGPSIQYGFLSLAQDGTLYVVTNGAMVMAVQTGSHGLMQNSGGAF